MELLCEKTEAHSGWIRSIAFSPDGTKIVSTGNDRAVKVWDVGAPEPSNHPLLGQN